MYTTHMCIYIYSLQYRYTTARSARPAAQAASPAASDAQAAEKESHPRTATGVAGAENREPETGTRNGNTSERCPGKAMMIRDVC